MTYFCHSAFFHYVHRLAPSKFNFSDIHKRADIKRRLAHLETLVHLIAELILVFL
jgi:hypothetical protein